MHEKDDIRDKKVQDAMIVAEAMEKTAYALKSESGQMVFSLFLGRLQKLKHQWENLAKQRLKGPYYEYSKADLNEMKAYQAKMEEFELFIQEYQNPEDLLAKAKAKRAEASAYEQNEPVTPAY